MANMINNPVDFINNCWSKAEPVTSDKNQFEEYFPANRLLSFHPKFLELSARISILQKELPSWAAGCLIYNLLPKRT